MNTRTFNYVTLFVSSLCAVPVPIFIGAILSETKGNEVFFFSVLFLAYLLGTKLGRQGFLRVLPHSNLSLLAVLQLICLSVAMFHFHFVPSPFALALPLAISLVAGALHEVHSGLVLKQSSSGIQSIVWISLIEYCTPLLVIALSFSILLNKIGLISSILSIVSIGFLVMFLAQVFYKQIWSQILFFGALVVISLSSLSWKITHTLSNRQMNVPFGKPNGWIQSNSTSKPRFFIGSYRQMSSHSTQATQLCFVNIPAAIVKSLGSSVRNALVVGGVDGLAVRNLLGLPHIRKISLVTDRPDLVRLSQTTPAILGQNLGSLSDNKLDKVLFHYSNPLEWVHFEFNSAYDLILVDLPYSARLGDRRHFTKEFYSKLFEGLHKQGVGVVRLGSLHPSMALRNRSRLIGSIKHSLQSGRLDTHVYHANQLEETFFLVSHNRELHLAEFFLQSHLSDTFCQLQHTNITGVPLSLTSLNRTVHSTVMANPTKRLLKYLLPD